SDYEAEGVQSARPVAKVLRGAMPRDLPVEGVNQVRLVGMWRGARCPWGGNNVGRRPTRSRVAHPKWDQFTRQVMVCPYCGQPVKFSRRSKAWLLLVAPYLLVVVVDTLSVTKGHPSSGVLIVVVFLAVAGVVMFSLTARLERAN